MSRISRRRFIAGAGLFGASSLLFNPARSLIQNMVRGIIRDSQSRSNGGSPRNFVQFNIYGAPARYLFDHPLRPSDSDAFLPCVGIYNRFQKIDPSAPHLIGGYYSDVKVNGINMPHLWQYEVARAGGGSRPMAELMANMLMIRGGNLGNEAHPINCARQVCPVPGDLSINGLVADASRALIPAISVGNSPANRAFKSASGICVVEIPPEDPDYVAFLLEPFLRQGERDSRSPSSEVENAVGVLRAYSLSNNPGAEILYNERRKVEEELRSGMRNFQDAFAPLVKKYDDLFHRSMDLTPVLGVTDELIPGIKFPFDMPGKVSAIEGVAAHHFFGRIFCESDIRRMFHSARAQSMAQHFAIAEFALLEGLTSTLLLAPPKERGYTLTNLTLPHFYALQDIEAQWDEQSNTTRLSAKREPYGKFETEMASDGHGTGWIANIVGCSMFYRGFSSCLLELIDKLKAAPAKNSSGTLFDETVVQYATEFDRYPTDLGAGLSHNSSAYVTSLFSGIIPEPMVLGNVLVGRKTGGIYPAGTLGNAAPIPTLPNKVITINNISSTLSEMLGVPRIVPRAAALVKVENNRLSSTIEPGRNIEDEA